MSVTPSCASTVPSTSSTIEWTTDWGWMRTSIFAAGDAEEPAGLDHLQALVHEGGGVDRDLRPHAPGRVGEGLLARDAVEALARAVAEGAAGGGEDEPPHVARGGGRRGTRGARSARCRWAGGAPPSRGPGRASARRPSPASPCWRGRRPCRPRARGRWARGRPRRRRRPRPSGPPPGSPPRPCPRGRSTARRPERSTRRESRSRAPASATETTFGRCRATCSARTSTLPPAARPTTSKRPGKASTTRSTFVPMEPVEPRMERPFMGGWAARVASR